MPRLFGLEKPLCHQMLFPPSFDHFDALGAPHRSPVSQNVPSSGEFETADFAKYNGPTLTRS